ncbi:heterolocus tagous nuclear ribonucleoprotein C [Echinococcus multilocularis]|uniref:Heterolocus tagous nuclear ribonucleoprotein C n=1 Tax=Echinococcus multilocularis TaxID=6211 RepID=A0A087VY84_ECHMU|nr:heterolocus tagous nuclear ribonucleoprotein C [Echinococcus multilocularis]
MIGVSNITNRMDPVSLKSRVFVGNLNTLHIQKPELEAIFLKYGDIIGISVHKGYAFVQYANEMHARSAVRGEDGKTYFGMELDVTIASEPKNRKRGRPNTGNTFCNQPNLIDLALQNQALAAIGGQFSQLGFMSHHQQCRYNNTSNNSPSTVGFNMPGIFGNPLLNTAPKMPKLSFAASSRPPHHRRTSHPQSSASTAKRTRLENPQVGSSSTGNNRSTNLVPLIASKRGSVSPKSTASGDSSSSISKKRTSKTNDSVILDKLSGMTVDNGFDLQSITSSEGEDTTRVLAAATAGASPPPPTTTTTTSATVSVTPAVAAASSSSSCTGEDILICGQCRRLFDCVDVLVAHKSTDCCSLDAIAVAAAASTPQCRCKMAGEPDSMDCAYCGEEFHSAWELVSHCQSLHNLIIFTLSTTKLFSPSMKDEEEAEPPSPQQPEIGEEEERKLKEVVEQPSQNEENAVHSDEDYEDVDGIGGFGSSEDIKVPI